MHEKIIKTSDSCFSSYLLSVVFLFMIQPLLQFIVTARIANTTTRQYDVTKSNVRSYSRDIHGKI